MSGGGDLENLRILIPEVSSPIVLFGRCVEVIWFMRFSVPLQIVLQSGHLCKLCGNCVGFDGIVCGLFSIKLDLELELPELNPFCFLCVIKCFFSVLISRNGRLHS